ncbi:hypothetical protein [Pimelobacter simplex]|uniref:hypothetical protein n=1 Tax=Nocardioides simplex TaxID=2045 RepID=UPI003AAB9956
MTASTDLDDTLANIRARAEAATPGPWFVEPCGDFGAKTALIPDVLRERYGANALNCGEDFATAEFIAHARADVELLLTLVDEQRAVIARVREVLVEAERRTAASLSCDFNGNRFQSPIAQEDLRAALDGADTTTTDGSEA